MPPDTPEPQPNFHLDTHTRTATNRYDRQAAVAYALRWGPDPANQFSEAVGLDIATGTDCTNFASQVLYSGGVLLTDWWYYATTRHAYEDRQIIKKKTPNWAGARFLHRSLIKGEIFTPPAVLVKHTPNSHFQDDEGLQVGDLVFYDTGMGYPDHVAVVVDFDSTEAANPVPVVVDHGKNREGLSYDFLGTIHRYDAPKTNWQTAVFVKIPDHFTQTHVLIDNVPPSLLAKWVLRVNRTVTDVTRPLWSGLRGLWGRDA